MNSIGLSVGYFFPEDANRKVVSMFLTQVEANLPLRRRGVRSILIN